MSEANKQTDSNASADLQGDIQRLVEAVTHLAEAAVQPVVRTLTVIGDNIGERNQQVLVVIGDCTRVGHPECADWLLIELQHYTDGWVNLRRYGFTLKVGPVAQEGLSVTHHLPTWAWRVRDGCASCIHPDPMPLGDEGPVVFVAQDDRGTLAPADRMDVGEDDRHHFDARGGSPQNAREVDNCIELLLTPALDDCLGEYIGDGLQEQ
jgi:hypothetical protein